MIWYVIEMKKKKELKVEIMVDDIKVDLKFFLVKVIYVNWVIGVYIELDS